MVHCQENPSLKRPQPFSKINSESLLPGVSYKAQTLKTFLDYCYNNNVSAAPSDLWQMSLELGVKSLSILHLIQCSNKSPNDVEIWRQAERRSRLVGEKPGPRQPNESLLWSQHRHHNRCLWRTYPYIIALKVWEIWLAIVGEIVEDWYIR